MTSFAPVPYPADLLPTLSVTPIETPFYRQFGLQVGILRLDQIDPEISGNKWFKLLPLLAQWHRGEKQPVFSFGGVWSNHIHALAYAGFQYGMPTTAFIRGYEDQPDTLMLKDAKRWGMQIRFLGREAYRQKSDPRFLEQLAKELPGYESIPEGGSSAEAVTACALMWQQLGVNEWQESDYLYSALGTGATFAGLLMSAPSQCQLVAVPVLKLGEGAKEMVAEHLKMQKEQPKAAWRVDSDAHWGGYAKAPAALLAFQLAYEQQTGVLLDPVYTAKMVSAFHRDILAGNVKAGSRILLVHTGGLQGRRGVQVANEIKGAAFCGPQPV